MLYISHQFLITELYNNIQNLIFFFLLHSANAPYIYNFEVFCNFSDLCKGYPQKHTDTERQVFKLDRIYTCQACLKLAYI